MPHSHSGPSILAFVEFVRSVVSPITRADWLFRPDIFSEPVTSQHFHFARIRRGDTLYTSLARHEHYLATFLNLRSGMRVLELGCGTGSAALELANFANVSILGVDNDPNNIRTAVSMAQSTHMTARVAFLNADFLRPGDVLPAEDFDCIYAIEALKVHPTFEMCFHEIRRMLKPGGKFAVYEWCWTTTFNELNPEHCRLAELIETTTGIGRRSPSERSIEAAVSAICKSGLQLIHTDDLTTHQDDKPWYFPLEVALADPSISWQSGANICGGLSKTAATILVEAGKRKLFTPMALFVGQRPH